MFDQKDVIKQIISYEIELTNGEIISVSQESVDNMFVNWNKHAFIIDKGSLYTRYRELNTPWFKVETEWQWLKLSELFITDVSTRSGSSVTDAIEFWEFNKWLVKGGRYPKEKEN